ncbi:MAG: hypothetical protein J2P50_20455 [Hyphomicrobiaceae bacterium]|nr:hypothetical protein [Hyphomicrobiaceae bacterium]
MSFGKSHGKFLQLPPSARAGLCEPEPREATSKQAARRLRFGPGLGGCYAARQIGESVYGCETLVAKAAQPLAGPRAGEVINLSRLAIRHDLTADGLEAAIFAYRTGASGIASMR